MISATSVKAYLQFSIMLPGADGALKLKKIMENIRNNPINIPGIKTIKIEDYLLRTINYSDGKKEELKGFDLNDTIKYYLEDGSFVAIRPSGTEPKCKIYLSTKASSYKEAILKANDFKDFLSSVVK